MAHRSSPRRLHWALLAWLLSWSSFSAATTHTLSSAQFWPVPCQGATGAGEKVQLPHSWLKHGIQRGGIGCYSLQIPRTVNSHYSGIYLSQTPTSRKIIFNDRVIEDSIGRQGSMPRLLTLPEHPQKVSGDKTELKIQIEPGRWSRVTGLGIIHFGPLNEIKKIVDRDEFYSSELPIYLNVGAIIIAALVLAAFAIRQQEKTLGYFGLLATVVSLRNLVYEFGFNVSQAAMEIYTYSSQLWSVGLTLLFCLELTQPQSKSQQKSVFQAFVGWNLIAAVIITLGHTAVIKKITYPLIIGIGFFACGLLLWRYRQNRDNMITIFLACFSLSLLAGVFDYIQAQSGAVSVKFPAIEYATPIAVIMYSFHLLLRSMRALSEVELLKADLEQRVIQRTEAIEKLNEERTLFLRAASHDLRQPIHALGLQISLWEKSSSEEDKKHIHQQIVQSVDYIETFARDMLDLAQLEQASVSVRIAAVALDPLLSQVVSILEPSAKLYRSVLHVDSSAAVVKADAHLLRRVLSNLVHNALKFSAGSEVWLRARQRGQWVDITVADRGLGIANEHLKKIFEPFYRVPSQHVSEGAGLGLAITAGFCQLMHCQLRLRSRLGHGTVFRLRLAAADSSASAAPMPLVSTGQWADKPVLLVEDDPQVLRATAELLRQQGAWVMAAPSLAQAKQLVRDSLSEPELWLLDYQLPDGTGLELVQWLHQQGYHSPWLMLSGTSQEGLAQAVRDLGGHWLQKPLSPERLLHQLNQLLDSNR